MTSLPTIIKDLLLNEDSITVPGFGTFETSYQSAQLSDNGIITPPSKLVTLNTDKKEDPDNKLIKLISNSQGISENLAQTIIDEFKKLVAIKVADKSTVEIDGVGTISLNDEGKLELKAAPSRLSIDNYGMDIVEVEPVSAADRPATVAAAATATSKGKTTVTKPKDTKSTSTQKVTTTTTTTTTETTTKEEKKKDKSKLFWLLVILLPIIAILTVLFFLFKDKILGNNEKEISSIETVTTPKDNNYTDETDLENNESEPETTTEENRNPVHIDSDLEILAKAGFSNVAPQYLGSKYKKYYLVAGSFTDQKNARAEKKRLNAKDILKIDGNEYYRVVYIGSDKAQEIVDEYNKLKAKGIKESDVWLLKNSQ